VSIATVSAVVNGQPNPTVRIGDEVKQRVLESVAALGYVPDPVARRLVGGRNRIIGVFAYEGPFPIEERSFFQPFLVGIEEVAQEARYDVLLHTGTMTEDGRRSIYGEGDNRLRLSDGAVILGAQTDAEELARLMTEGYPFIHVGRRDVPGVEIPFVAPDYVQAVGDLVRHLVSAGYDRIVYLADARERDAEGRTLREPIRDRENGFNQAIENLGGALETFRVLWSPDDIDAGAVRALLSNRTALVIEKADLAYRCELAARAIGWHAPQDFAFAVLGDPPSAGDPLPDWTMIRISRREIGRIAATELLALLDGRRDPKVARLVPCEIRIGTSTTPPTRDGNTISRPGERTSRESKPNQGGEWVVKPVKR
jgi:DNA-binding LacI/PurR family transcriptional regulator